jgi:regulator of nucleoside diphosphate kinase
MWCLALIVTVLGFVGVPQVETGEEKFSMLRFQSETDIEENKILILPPIGTAILGYRAGDHIERPVLTGVKTLRIEAVLYQPQAAATVLHVKWPPPRSLATRSDV